MACSHALKKGVAEWLTSFPTDDDGSDAEFAAVIVQFGRESSFLEAFMRCIMWVLWMLVVDERFGCPQGGRGQSIAGMQQVFTSLGARHAIDRQQKMEPRTVFLGITHDLAVVVG